MEKNNENGVPTIKVHVTPVQRELLEFLVNRRLNDIHFLRRGSKATDGETEEMKNLEALKYELRHAGT